MFRFLRVKVTLLAAIQFSAAALSAAEITSTDSYYTYPMEGVARLYSANFGEMRPNHFHSGIDIKSDGEEGKRIVAAADGYISRLSISPSGYGLSLYIAHPNGTTTQYGHLSKFRDDISQYAEDERYKQKRHSINIFLTEHQFPVKRGDLIAYSGNTGSSSGPHLHFEIRESKNQRPKNSIAMGVIRPMDKIAPLFFNLYYIESETIDGVTYPGRVSTYELTKLANGEYQVAGNRIIWVGREGHFVVSTSDRKANVSNSFGVYRIEGFTEGEKFYNHKQDGFMFANTRYCNSVSYYPMQRKTSVEHYRLRRQEGLPKSMLNFVEDDGMIRTNVGDQRKISIVATDDMGNHSTLRFTIRGKDEKDCFRAKIDTTATIARAKSTTSFKGEGVRIKIPSGTLYESIPYSVKRLPNPPQLEGGVSGVEICSPEYMIFDYDTPLHRAMEITIEANVKPEDHDMVVMVYSDDKGQQSAIKTTYKDGGFTSPSRTAGRVFMAIDRVAPAIEINIAEGADMSSEKSIPIYIKDNFSGIESYEATLDGRWIALDMHKDTITHHFRDEPSGGIHELKVTVRDLVGNESSKSISFKR